MKIKGISDSAAKLSHQLMLFSRKQHMDFKLININKNIEELTKMLRRIIKENDE